MNMFMAQRIYRDLYKKENNKLYYTTFTDNYETITENYITEICINKQFPQEKNSEKYKYIDTKLDKINSCLNLFY